MLEHDPSNPFLVPRSSPANETGAVPAAPVPTSTTEPLSAISQLENTLLQHVSSLPSLKHQVAVLERKKIADTRSVEQNLRRIEALEEEIEARRTEIERMKEENERLNSPA